MGPSAAITEELPTWDTDTACAGPAIAVSAAARPGRYRLLETVRQYLAAQLDAQAADAASHAQTAHRDYYLALAEAVAPQLAGPDQAAWLDRLDAELGNLRAAIDFSQAQPDPLALGELPR